MLARVGATNGRDSATSGHKELITITKTVIGFRLYHDHRVKVQSWQEDYCSTLFYLYLKNTQCRPVTFLYYVQNPFLPPPQKKKIKKITNNNKNLKKLKIVK